MYVKRDAFQRDVSRPRPWGQTEGGKGPLVKTQNAWEEGEESKQRAWFTGAAASLALSFTGDSIPGLSEWEDAEALGQPPQNLNTSSNIPQEPSCLTRYPFHHRRQTFYLYSEQLVGGKDLSFHFTNGKMESLADTPASHSWSVQTKPGSYPALGIIEVVTKTSQDKHSLERKLITFCH